MPLAERFTIRALRHDWPLNLTVADRSVVSVVRGDRCL
jgi:hypothetical protein